MDDLEEHYVDLDRLQSILDAVEQALPAKNYDVSKSVLIAHLQKVICSQASYDDKEALRICDEVVDDLKYRVLRYVNMANGLPLPPPRSVHLPKFSLSE